MLDDIFNEASRAGLYLLAAFFILVTYRIGQRGLHEDQRNELITEVIKCLVFGVGSILIIALVIAFVFYGASSCDDNGDCTSGFEVTTEQRIANMTFWSVLFGVPYIAGGIDACSKAKGRHGNR